MIPKMSVVMACYNEEDVVEQAINSILNQTFEDFEFIIIDDGSKDRTPQIIQKMAQSDSRIVFLQNEENINLAGSLNRGIKKAKAEFIVRMDADDLSRADRLERHYQYLAEHPKIEVLGSNARLIKNGKIIGLTNVPRSQREMEKSRYRKSLFIHPSVTIRKRAFNLYGYYDENLPWAEDTDLWLRWLDNVQFANLEEPLIDYSLKQRINPKIAYYNNSVLFKNMVRRNDFFRNIHLFIRSILSHFFRLVLKK
jgi:glycosyltransferase involved in cell wall biosynthesis